MCIGVSISEEQGQALDAAESKWWSIPKVMSLHFTMYKISNGTHPALPLAGAQHGGKAHIFIFLIGRDLTWPLTGSWSLLSLAPSPGSLALQTDIASSLPSNICSVGPPSERVGTWWWPGSETVHYEQRIILPSIKCVITARCSGDGHTIPCNNHNYEPGEPSAQQTPNFWSQKKWGRIAH